jgi:hypothetical protein
VGHYRRGRGTWGTPPWRFTERGTIVGHSGGALEQQQQQQQQQRPQQQRFRGISLEVGDAWSAEGGQRTGRSINLQLSTAADGTARDR